MKNIKRIFILLMLFVMPLPVLAEEEYIDQYMLDLVGSNSSNSFSVINLGTNGTCTNTLAYDNNGTNNLRYVGANPCNYVMFNGERWRIIGLFDSDTHGQNGKRLVKIVRDEPLFTGIYDYKKNNVGSSSGSGSSEWSDAEIMMLLNPTDYINTGYKADGTLTHTYTINNTGTNANYVVANSKNIYRNMGSYYNGGTIYLPAQVNNSGWNSNTTGNFNKLNAAATDMIAETTWGTAGLTSAQTVKLASDFYSAERGTTAFSANNSVKWVGKIGLLYPSDYGYATSATTAQEREDCLTTHDMGAWSTHTECFENNWLRKVANANATSDSDRSNAVQFTMTSSIRYSTSVYTINTNGSIVTYGVNTQRAMRPTLFLKDDTKIYSGTGTWSDPFILEYQEVEDRYTVTYTDGVDNEVVFADQVYSDLRVGQTTPAFNGTPTRTGYTFLGWSPTVASTVTADVTYVAQWQAEVQTQYADLEINKQVTGNMADIDELFEFQITVTDNGVGINGSYDYYVGTTLQQNQLTFTNGVATVNISSVNNVTIKDMEVGYDYSISEVQANGYTATSSIITGTINNTNNVVTFVNNKEQAPETGREVDLEFAYSFILIGPAAIFFIKKNKMK